MRCVRLAVTARARGHSTPRSCRRRAFIITSSCSRGLWVVADLQQRGSGSTGLRALRRNDKLQALVQGDDTTLAEVCDP